MAKFGEVMDAEYKIMLKKIGINSKREEKKSDQLSRPTRRVNVPGSEPQEEVIEPPYIVEDELSGELDSTPESISILDNPTEIEEYNPEEKSGFSISTNNAPTEHFGRDHSSVPLKKNVRRKSHPTTVMNPWEK